MEELAKLEAERGNPEYLPGEKGPGRGGKSEETRNVRDIAFQL